MRGRRFEWKFRSDGRWIERVIRNEFQAIILQDAGDHHNEIAIIEFAIRWHPVPYRGVDGAQHFFSGFGTGLEFLNSLVHTLKTPIRGR